jgi:hypothetical protein
VLTARIIILCPGGSVPKDFAITLPNTIIISDGRRSRKQIEKLRGLRYQLFIVSPIRSFIQLLALLIISFFWVTPVVLALLVARHSPDSGKTITKFT